jgi:hypothetical protein
LILVVEFVFVSSDSTLQLLAVFLIFCILFFNVLLLVVLSRLPLFKSFLIVDVAQTAARKIPTRLVILVSLRFRLHATKQRSIAPFTALETQFNAEHIFGADLFKSMNLLTELAHTEGIRGQSASFCAHSFDQAFEGLDGATLSFFV